MATKPASFLAPAVIAVLITTTAPVATLAAKDPAEQCHQDIAAGMASIKKGRVGQLSRCLKFGNYDNCPETDSHTAEHESDARHRIALGRAACLRAVEQGASVADFGPTSCGNEYVGCDVEVPSINTLDDLASCVICSERGFDALIRDTLGWPREFPDDKAERACTRVAHRAAQAIKKAIYQTARCARGGAKPFDCPVDDSPESRFGRALASIEKSVARCRIEQGEAPGALVNLCHGEAGSSAELAACFTGLARCLACRGASTALGQDLDCVAFSGFARCDGTF